MHNVFYGGRTRKEHTADQLDGRPALLPERDPIHRACPGRPTRRWTRVRAFRVCYLSV